jgi:hypothetical protein
MPARSRRRCSAGSAGLFVGLLAALLSGTTLGCVVYRHGHPHPVLTPTPRHAAKHGPPPHAPAHGYRHKHAQDGLELVYDAGVEVYVVFDREAVYWDGVRYLRWVNGEWQASVEIDGVWLTIGSAEVPAKLVERHPHRPRKAHKKGHGHAPPARHSD